MMSRVNDRLDQLESDRIGDRIEYREAIQDLRRTRDEMGMDVSSCERAIRDMRKPADPAPGLPIYEMANNPELSALTDMLLAYRNRLILANWAKFTGPTTVTLDPALYPDTYKASNEAEFMLMGTYCQWLTR
jgi:hypothetical protein